jgi:hypothetical protein
VVVNLPGQSDWVGQTIAVRILRAGPNSLSGEAAHDSTVDIA